MGSVLSLALRSIEESLSCLIWGYLFIFVLFFWLGSHYFHVHFSVLYIEPWRQKATHQNMVWYSTLHSLVVLGPRTKVASPVTLPTSAPLHPELTALQVWSQHIVYHVAIEWLINRRLNLVHRCLSCITSFISLTIRCCHHKTTVIYQLAAWTSVSKKILNLASVGYWLFIFTHCFCSFLKVIDVSDCISKMAVTEPDTFRYSQTASFALVTLWCCFICVVVCVSRYAYQCLR